MKEIVLLVEVAGQQVLAWVTLALPLCLLVHHSLVFLLAVLSSVQYDGDGGDAHEVLISFGHLHQTQRQLIQLLHLIHRRS